MCMSTIEEARFQFNFEVNLMASELVKARLCFLCLSERQRFAREIEKSEGEH